MLPLLICQGKKGHVHIIVCMYTVPKYVHANQLIAGGWRGGGMRPGSGPQVYMYRQAAAASSAIRMTESTVQPIYIV
jgi:carbohydrate-binding DOMON domain-containing protein